MTKKHPHDRMQLRSCLGFFVAAACWSMAIAHAAIPAECIVQCDAGKCLVNKVEEIPKETAKSIKVCPSATLDAGTVVGMFRGARGMERFKIATVDPVKPFSQLVPAIDKATCSVSRSCIEDRDMRRVAGIGGKGADEDRVVHEGRPCELGLPCGQILKPKTSLVIRPDGVTNGKLVLTGKRGADKSPLTFDVSSGGVEIPADKLVSGAVYTYALQGAATPVRGEFSVMSTKMQNDVEKAIADVKRTQPEQSALGEVEILIEEDLQWDAAQRLK